MSPTEILFIVCILGGLIAFATIIANRNVVGSWVLAAALCVLFAGYTAVQIGREGAEMFWINHSQNLTGIQVWWDLIMALLIALFFVAPRARKAGMNVPLWGLFVGCTASIGLLAMIARLFWLERSAATEAA